MNTQHSRRTVSRWRSVRTFGIVAILCLSGLALAPARADDYRGGGPGLVSGSQIDGWRFGGRRDSGGFEIYRRGPGGWYRVPGSGIQLGGDPRNPWLINSQYEIYRWSGNRWQRVSGSAIKVIDGWVLGTDRRSGGYGIYRWDGRRFVRVPGSAVDIGGSFNRPWIVNDRGIRFEWTGRDWREVGRGRGNAFGYQDRDNRRDDGRFDWNDRDNRRDNDWYDRNDRDRGRDNNRNNRRDVDRNDRPDFGGNDRPDRDGRGDNDRESRGDRDGDRNSDRNDHGDRNGDRDNDRGDRGDRSDDRNRDQNRNDGRDNDQTRNDGPRDGASREQRTQGRDSREPAVRTGPDSRADAGRNRRNDRDPR